ncbi:UPF0390 protein [Fusarium oxysporum f. sp. conglutinans]|nr:UPF0390 protein [Fusarium oxysporum f. sp. conglutinans]
MAQGTVKKLGRATPAKITHSKRQASKVHKPKKTKASVDKVHKKFTSGMTARTEALLGERAGHLELLGQGKKKTDKKTTQKGGSKKFEYKDGAWVPPEAHNHPSDSDSDGEGDDLIDVYEVIDLTEGIQDTEELVDDDDPEDEVTDGVTKYLVTQLLAITQDPPKDITPYLMPDVSLPVVEADQQLFKSTVTSMLERAQRYAMK